MKTKAAVLLMALLLVIGSVTYAAERYVWADQGGVAFFEENGKVGLQDAEGKVLCEAIFDDADYFDDNGQANVYIDGKIGRIDRTGTIVVSPFPCGILAPSGEGVLQYKLGDGYSKGGFIALDGREISGAVWDGTYGFQNGYAFVRRDGKWNRIDMQGNITSQEWWDDVVTRRSYTNCNVVQSANEKVYFDAEGNTFAYFKGDGEAYWLETVWINGKIIDSEGWTDVTIQQNGYYTYEKDGRWGVIDADGETVLAPQDGFVSNGKTPLGIWSIEKDRKYGWIDSEGKTILDMKYTGIDPVAENRWLLTGKDEEDSIIADETGGVIASFTSEDSSYSIKSGYINYHKNRTSEHFTWGYMDSNGVVLSEMNAREFWLAESGTFSEGYQVVRRFADERNGFVDVYGNAVFSDEWTAHGNFSHGLLCVVTDDTITFVNTKGEFVHETRWLNTYATDYFFTGGQWIARVGVRNPDGTVKYGYINDQGEPICMIKSN